MESEQSVTRLSVCNGLVVRQGFHAFTLYRPIARMQNTKNMYMYLKTGLPVGGGVGGYIGVRVWNHPGS